MTTDDLIAGLAERIAERPTRAQVAAMIREALHAERLVCGQAGCPWRVGDAQVRLCERSDCGLAHREAA